jgi:hypothetical protein
MMERASSNGSQTRHKVDRFRVLSPEEPRLIRPSTKVKWRFKPRSFGTLVTWGLILFVAGRIVVVPLVEGVCQYFSKTKELAALRQRSQMLDKQTVALKKTYNYMQTDAYVEEKGHQIGLIKKNESQMVVVNPNELKRKGNRTKKHQEEIYQD